MEFERTTIELKKVYVLPSKHDIERLLKDVQGFQEVEKVDGRKVIVKHNSGAKDRIVDELKKTYQDAKAERTAKY